MSINLNIEEYTIADLQDVSIKLEPNSLNLFLENSSVFEAVNSKNRFLETIQAINQIQNDIIAFGNGFDYDSCQFNPNDMDVLENLKYHELSFHTLATNSPFRIKSRKNGQNSWG